MFGQGNFRPMMGEVRLAQAYQAPVPAPAPAATPAPALAQAAAAPAPAPVPPPADTGGIPHSTQVLVAGAIAVLTILGAIFLTD
jgi:hypothetical protein